MRRGRDLPARLGQPCRMFAERWNGTRWTVQRTQRTPGGFLASVWCQSATACIATGSTNAGTLAERLSGTTWTVVHTPSLPGTQGDFLGSVSCTSLSACTAAGGVLSFPQQTLAERWNGARWRIQPTPLLPGIGLLSSFSVACPAPSACIAAGGFEHDGPGSVSLAERLRGTGTSTAHSAPAAFSPRADRGIAGCARAAMGAGVAIRATASPIGPRISTPTPQRIPTWCRDRTDHFPLAAPPDRQQVLISAPSSPGLPVLSWRHYRSITAGRSPAAGICHSQVRGYLLTPCGSNGPG